MEAEIRTELNRVNALRFELNAQAEKQGCKVEQLVGIDGTHLLTPLVLARSNLLLALAIYKNTKSGKNRTW